MLKVGDRIVITVDNKYIQSYVRNCCDSILKFEGTYLEEDSNFPNSIIIKPIELEKDKNFFPKIRAISKRLILDIIKIDVDESSRVDLTNIDDTKVVRKFKVNSSDKTKQYDVFYYPKENHYTCNCYAGLMRRECKHIKGVARKIENEIKKEAS